MWAWLGGNSNGNVTFGVANRLSTNALGCFSIVALIIIGLAFVL